ncbi:glycoside hydrolase family 3 protein [Xylogone sp. PMI_703]|nr:glycoside hydrolase family 3 protein [Xylogone sp. PMI_703]
MHQSVFSLLALLATPLLAAPGDGDWASAYTKANAALAKLSNNQKVSLVTGTGWMKGPCVGNLAAISSIGFPQLCLQDGPLGVRYAQQVTAFPAGITTGSTWDTGLMYARGNALGAEAKGLGVHVQLGPVAGPLGKIPVGGRNWEGFSVDPYLSGVAMANTVEGMQAAGVQACAKHYIANEQERNRDSMSSNVNDRTLHELYLWGFAEAVRANVTSVMCSYNRLNSSFACENKHILTDLLKNELDFQGYVLSDWAAQHTTTGSANAGMDMAMPGDNFGDNNFLWGQNLLNAVNSGQVPQSRLDDMATRVLAAWYFVGQDQGYPSVTGWTSWNGGGGGPNVQGTHKDVARQIARDGIVLLKNTNNALPLNKPASLALIGQDAIVNPSGPNACNDRACDTGTLAMGWGSGTAQFPYLVAPYDAIKTRAASDGTTLTTATSDTPSSGASAASAAATAIVFINADSGEGYLTVEGQAGDRANLDPWHNGNALVQAVAAVNKNTIVVVHSVGPLILETILALPNVVAVVWAGIPGQESGNGLVDVLYGSTSPSGKLPYTIAKAQADYGTAIANGDDSFPEGLYVDYRHFDQAGIAPRYEFGFGLSYTTFSYSSLTASSITIPPGPDTPRPGGSSKLYNTVATVTAVITNNGTVTGAEVPQLYIGLPSSAPSSPPKQLRGFTKVSLQPGQSKTVTFNLRLKDLSYWDTSSQSWILPSGTFSIYVGASSRDIRLTGTISSTGGSGPSSTSAGGSTTTSTSRGVTTTTTVRTTTTTSRTTTSSPPSGTGSPLWGQCGGQGWTGPTTCASGTCTYSNPYYSQCLP